MNLFANIIEQIRTDYRPWGYYTVLSDRPDCKVKRLVVYPGKRLSLQRHKHRSEHWYILSGNASIVKSNIDPDILKEEIVLLAGQSIEIPVGYWHRIRNSGNDILTIIEIQTGTYFGEDDIERLEDDFGRV